MKRTLYICRVNFFSNKFSNSIFLSCHSFIKNKRIDTVIVFLLLDFIKVKIVHGKIKRRNAKEFAAQ